MGKKSKRGTSRAGSKAHPKAGAGKSRNRSRSFDGSSMASSEQLMPSETISVDSTDAIPNAKANVAPATVSTPRNMQIEVTNSATNGAKEAATEETTPVVEQLQATASPVAVEATPLDVSPVEKASVTTLAAEVGKVPPPEDALSASGAAVEEWEVVPDEEVKQAIVDAAEAALKEEVKKAVTAEPVVEEPESGEANKSRGLALDEPAPKEAAAKQKDCECIIL